MFNITGKLINIYSFNIEDVIKLNDYIIVDNSQLKLITNVN